MVYESRPAAVNFRADDELEEERARDPEILTDEEDADALDVLLESVSFLSSLLPHPVARKPSKNSVAQELRSLLLIILPPPKGFKKICINSYAPDENSFNQAG